MLFILIFLSSISLPYVLSEDWTIHVYTGTERFAGTDANVFIRLFNSEHGYTNEYELAQENWLYGDALFPYKDLFENGAHDRFRVSTGSFEYVEKIHVRRDHFPMIRSDWFIDRIIVERNRDSRTFIFSCHCWLHSEQPYVIISVSSDLHSNGKNNIFQDKQIIIFIVLMSVVLLVCLLYCFHGYCSYHSSRHVHTESDFPFLDQTCVSFLEPSAPVLPNDFMSSIATQQVLSSNDNNLRRSVITQSTDEPPAYRDLFPD